MVRLRYDLDAYDQYCCLKPPTALIVSLLFLCRALVLPLAMYLAAMNQNAPAFGVFIYGSDPMLSLIGAVPALAVLVALKNRTPTAGSWMRLIWSNGKFLLLGSMLIQVLPVARSLLDQNDWTIADSSPSAGTAVSLSMLCVYVGLFVYLLTSKRVSDAFRDFPQSA